jgi:hypothetical protein
MELLDGFQDHGWSGKLFMLVQGATLATWTVGYVALLWAGLMGGAVGFVSIGFDRIDGWHVPMSLVASLLAGLLVLLFQWKALLAVARFRSWAWYFAMLVSALGLLSALMVVRVGTAKIVAIGLLQAALAAQFLLYFFRNRDRFTAVHERVLL